MRTTIKIWILSCFLWFFDSGLKAGVLSFHQRIEAGLNSCPTIPEASACAATTVAVSPATGAFRDYSVDDIITLGIDHNNLTYYPDSMLCVVNLKILQWNSAGSPLPTVYKTLHVRYSPFTYTTYLDKAAFLLKDAYTVTVKIDTITVNGVSSAGETLPANVYLDADIQLVRYYNFTTNASTPITVSPADTLDVDCNDTTDEIMVGWTPIVGAEQYDLEWTFVNDYTKTPGVYLTPSHLSYNFRFNSTRITTSATSYTITNAYEHGYLIYRVRGVGNDMYHPAIYETGVWSLADSNSVNTAVSAGTYYHVWHAHESDRKDWQYNSTFAEEGKKKEVITYYDGSLRSREAVTKMNSDSNVLVGQTIYDYQGRPAVTVLPVPVQFPSCGSGHQPVIHYYPKFNIDDSLHPYTRLDFDLDNPTDSCTIGTKEMNTGSGAANYYSPSNPRQLGWQSYVPDAHKYPFSQVQYTPDNTGRIRAQGGVGPQFQLGSHHETDYIYGQPNQVELDRMFGEEVGWATHYKKNVVVDPNGQSSISYLDQEGRTIATCLAGYPAVDSNGKFCLDTLKSAAHQNMTVDMLGLDANGHSDNNSVNVEGTSIVFNTQLCVAYTSPYSFKYFLEVDTLGVGCLNDICLSCIYDLQIEIANDCGTLIYSKDTMEGHFTLSRTHDTVIFSAACPGNPIDSNTREFTVNLNPGNYTVSKILTVDTSALHFYEQAYLDSLNNTCIKKPSYFQKQYVSDTCNCHINCAACVQSLGSRDAFVASGKGSAEEYDFLYEQCEQPCKPVTECDMEYDQMLRDVSPDGQYGQYLNDTGVCDPTQFPLSVFNQNNVLSANVSHTGNWRHPEVILNRHTYPYYIDEHGNRSTIVIVKTPSGFLPRVLDSVVGVNIFSTNGPNSTYYTHPENLLNFQDFRNEWQDSWAQSLVLYHPEYCYYKICQQYENVQPGDTTTSETFDDRMSKTKDFTDAASAGFVVSTYTAHANPLSKLTNYFALSNPEPDPFFIDGTFTSDNGGTSPLSLLKSYLGEYKNVGGANLSMPAYAALTARTATLYGNAVIPNAIDTDFGENFVASPAWVNDSIRKKEWEYFISYYHSAKEIIQKSVEDYYTLNTCSGYNGCIGYSTFPNLPWQNPLLAASQFSNPSQPCSQTTYTAYANKQMRFSSQNSIPPADTGQNNCAYQYYLQTGQCPQAAALMEFLSSVAASRKLTSEYDTLTSDPYFTYGLWEAMNPHPAVTAPGYIWSASPFDTTGGILTASILDPSAAISCTMSLNVTGSGITNWEQIAGFTGLAYSYSSGGLDYFTAYAQLKNPADSLQPFRYVPVTGSSCVDIHGCTFPLQSQPNQFAIDIQSLMSELANTGNLLTSSFNLESSPYSSFLTPSIVNSIGPPNSNLRWTYVSPNEFKIFDNTNPGVSINIYFNTYNPATFTYSSLPTIKMFDSINNAYQNNFTMNGADASGHTIVKINGDIIYDSNAVIRGVNVGNASLPTPLLCQGVTYQNVSQLQTLLTNILTKKPFKGDINLLKSPDITPELQSYLPAILDSTSSKNDTGTVHNKFYDTLTFTYWINDTVGGHVHKDSMGCPFYLTRIDSANAINPVTGHPDLRLTYSELVSVEDLTGYGNLFQGSYTDFYFIGVFKVPNGSGYILMADTIRGSSCIPLLNCGCSKNTASLVNYSGGAGNDTSCPAHYNRWVQEVDSFNSSPYAISHGHYLTMLYHNFSDFDYAGLCHCTQNYLSYLEGFIPHPYSSTPTYTTQPVNINFYPHCDSATLDTGCHALYDKWVMEVDSFNHSAYAHLHSFYLTLPYTSYTDFSAAGLCNCAKKYFNYLHPYLNPSPPNLPDPTSISFYGPCDSITGDTSCAASYQKWVYKIIQFDNSLYARTTHDTLQIIYATLNQFEAAGLCNCAKGYLGYLNTYINWSGGSPPPGPVNINEYGPCGIPFDTCKKMYDEYLTAINNYNASAYISIHPSYTLAITYTSVTQFESAGLCNCALGYIEVLATYTATSFPPNPPPTIANYGPCGPDTCKKLYDYWVAMVDSFNTSHYRTLTGVAAMPLTYSSAAQFEAAGLCNCAASYIDYLAPYSVWATTYPTAPPVTIDRYGPCVSDTCQKLYDLYILMVDSFNVSSYLTHTGLAPMSLAYSSAAQFEAAGLCNCAASYIDYLAAYLGTSTSTYSMSYPQLIASYGPCVSDTCKKQYEYYVAMIDSFNASPYVANTGVGMPLIYTTASQFEAAGLCNCASGYIDYMAAYLGSNSASWPHSPPVPIANYGPCASDTTCMKEYRKWLVTIDSFNITSWAMSHHDTLFPLFSSFAQFEAADLCGCVSPYLSYLHGFIVSASSPPVSITQFGPCDSILPDNSCYALYQQWVNTVDSFDVSTWAVSKGYWLHLPYADYTQFKGAGMCNCVATYLNYLITYLPGPHSILGTNPPAPKSIENYSSCNPSQVDTACEYLFYEWQALVKSYNVSSWAVSNHDTLQISYANYAQFAAAGNCSCAASYLSYLNTYFPGVHSILGSGPPPPLPIEKYGPCNDYDSLCTVEYDRYVQKVDSFNASSYAATYGYSLPLDTGFTVFLGAGFCNCLSSYLTYLSNYLPPSPSISSNIGAPESIYAYGPCDAIIADSSGSCDTAYISYITAVDKYNAFVKASADTALRYVSVIYPPSDFIQSGYCYCVYPYITMLQSIENGTYVGPGFNVVTGENIVVATPTGGHTTITYGSYLTSYLDIGFSCKNELTTPCVGSPQVDSLVSPIYHPKGGNPCVNQLRDNDTANAKYEYGQYMDSMHTVIRTAYMAHCLKPVENLISSYKDMQFHYTLYYYDQGGNLIRTVPPQGVQLLPISTYTASTEQSILRDRTNNRHTIFTDHVLGSDYLYNSLNQLTKQAVPDADNIQMFQYSLCDSLDPNLVVTGVQFVDAANGYLSGYVPNGTGRRGCLYKTFDGGNTWKKFSTNIGANLNRIVMTSSSNGYIAADYGILLHTSDGGNTWDILPLFANGVSQNLHGLAYNPSNGTLAVVGNGQSFGIYTPSNSYSAPSLPVATSDSMRSVTYDAHNNVFYAVGDSAGYGVMYYGNATATSWTKISSLSTLPINKITFIPGKYSHGYAGGDDGILLHTTDYGRHWYAVPNRIRAGFKDIFFGNDSVGISILDSATGYGMLCITWNGGKTWKRLSPKGTYFNAMSMYRDSASKSYKGVAVGVHGAVTRIVANASLESPYFGLVPVNGPTGNSWSFSSVFAQAMPSPVDSVYILIGEAGTGKLFYTTQCLNSAAIWDSTTLSTGGDPVYCSFAIHHGYMLPAVLDNSGKIHTLLNSLGATPSLSDVTPTFSVTTSSVLTEHGTTNGADTIYSYDGSTSHLDYFIPNGSGNELAGSVLTSSGATPAHLISLAYSGNNLISGSDSANEKIYTGVIGSGGSVTWTDVSNNTHARGLREVNTDITSSPVPVYAAGDYGTMLYSSVTTYSVMTYKTIWVPVKQNINAVGAPTSAGKGLFAGNFDSVYSFTYSGSGYLFSPITPQKLPGIDSIYDLSISGTTAYLAGTKGTVVYISNTGSLSSEALAVNGGLTTFLGVYLNSAGTAYAVGTNAVAWQYGGINGFQMKNLYPPGYNAVDFVDVNHGYAVGDYGMIQRTDNAGNNWHVVEPEVDSYGVPNLTRVRTTAAGHALICGTGFFFAQVFPNNTVSSTVDFTSFAYNPTLSYQVNDIGFFNQIHDTGFTAGLVGDAAIGFFTMNSDGTVKHIFGSSVSPYAFGIQKVHVFRDHSLIAAGTNGEIAYYSLRTNTWSDVSPDVTGSTTRYAHFIWNDIYFRDDLTGYVVGDSLDVSGNPHAGELLKVVLPIYIQQAVPTNYAWIAKPMQDNYNIIHPTYEFLNCIAFNGPYTGMIGGSYNAAVYTNVTPFPYARLIDDEGGGVLRISLL